MLRKCELLAAIILMTGVTVEAANVPPAKPYRLPWDIVGQKIAAKRIFGYKLALDPNRGLSRDNPIEDQFAHEIVYVLEPKDPVLVRLPEDHPSNYQEKMECVVTEWVGGKWQQRGNETLVRNATGYVLQSGLPAEGFFRLAVSPIAPGSKEAEAQGIYVAVCVNWKKDLVAFCQEVRTTMEQNRDEQFIYSSIVVSHVDHVLGLIDKAFCASGAVLRGLANVTSAKTECSKKRCPDLVVGGLNKILLRRFPGGPTAEFVVLVPDDYDPSRPWPVYIHVDPARVGASNYGVTPDWWGNGRHPGMIDVWWHALSNENLVWKEYKTLWAILRQKLNVDFDQFQIWGFCGNSAAAMSLALHYPDEWMRANLDLGNSHIYLAGNALNLRMSYARNSHHGEQESEAWYEFALRCFDYHGCRYVNNDGVPAEPRDLWCYASELLRSNAACFWPMVSCANETADWLERAGTRLDLAPQTRCTRPSRVHYTTGSLQWAKAYWVTVDGREDENFLASIDVSVKGPWVLVETDNVHAYTLDLSSAPVDLSRPVRIVENGRPIAITQERTYVRKPNRFKQAKLIKNASLSGPVSDAFTDPYVVVRGTGGGNTDIVKANQTAAQAVANGGPCFDDTRVPDQMFLKHNLVLVGTAESNRWIPTVSKDLPVKIEAGKVIANGKTYSGDVGYCLIYPNPLHSAENYVAVFSGTTAKAITKLPTALTQLQAMSPADVGIFEVSAANEIKWLVAESFDTTWGWHREWDKPLATIKDQHARWQWRQWVAEVLRKEMAADTTVYEDPFRYAQPSLQGSITLRDLFNNFQNRWIVKIRVDGKTLKQMLMTPFTDITRRTVGTPLVVAGINFSSEASTQPTEVSLSTFKNEQFYTIALPHGFVNYARLGLKFGNYEVVGEGRVIPLLKKYLTRQPGTDMDRHLSSMQNRIF